MTVAAVLGNPSSRTLLIASAPAVVFALVSFVPFLTVVVRRLHDAGHSGGWVLLLLFLVWAGNTAVDALPDNPVAYCVQLLAPLCLLLIGLLPFQGLQVPRGRGAQGGLVFARERQAGDEDATRPAAAVVEHVGADRLDRAHHAPEAARYRHPFDGRGDAPVFDPKA
jgi:uncharacterized membrane protein YhaH (DUF805 family)